MTRVSRLLSVLVALSLLSFTVSFSALATEFLEGQARIVDGDTIEIGSVKIRLQGIDAPETDQLCLDSREVRWTCGIEARDRLLARAGKAVWICTLSGRDRYGRSLGTCKVEGGDINKWMVANGWALSFTRYSHTYDADEASARLGRKGLWDGAFVAPWDWRARNTKTLILGALSVPITAQKLLLSAASAADAPSPECVVKGNRARSGECIYHLPGGHFYSAVKMDLNKGKRWFCSPEDAEAAGCRRSKL